jgi:hypothetical protein
MLPLSSLPFQFGIYLNTQETSCLYKNRRLVTGFVTACHWGLSYKPLEFKSLHHDKTVSNLIPSSVKCTSKENSTLQVFWQKYCMNFSLFMCILHFQLPHSFWFTPYSCCFTHSNQMCTLWFTCEHSKFWPVRDLQFITLLPNCVISGFPCEVDKNCDLLGYYTANDCNFLQKFWANISVPSSRVKNPKRKPAVPIQSL